MVKANHLLYKPIAPTAAVKGEKQHDTEHPDHIVRLSPSSSLSFH